MHFLTFYMDFMRGALLLLNIYIWIILAYCIASMISGFGLVDLQNNRFFITLFGTLARMVEPALQPIRAILPDMGIMDFSPLVLMFIIEYIIPNILKEIPRLVWTLQAF